jgi:hypothetical protein
LVSWLFFARFCPFSGPGALFWAVLSKPAADGKLQRGNGISSTEKPPAATAVQPGARPAGLGLKTGFGLKKL